jgi:aryl-alcohol dehydrogenase-like predicted oxidoreductase
MISGLPVAGATLAQSRRDQSGGWLPAQSSAELRAGVEENPRSLRIEQMDLVDLRLDSESGAASQPTAEQLGTTADLRREGKLDPIGISNATLEGGRMATSCQPPGGEDHAGRGGLRALGDVRPIADSAGR